MKEAEITRRKELNDRETEEIAAVLEGARPSNRIDVDRKKLRERLNPVLIQTGLIRSAGSDSEAPVSEEAFAQFAAAPESPRELRDQYRELVDLTDRLERNLRREELAPALAARLRWLSVRRPQGARNTKDYADKISGARILLDVRNALRLIKQAADELSNFNASQVTIGRPKDELLDLLMVELAEVYLAFRPEKDQIADLSASPKSLFLQFCFTVLYHFFSDEAIDAGTLAQRWRRLRESLRDTEEPLGV